MNILVLFTYKVSIVNWEESGIAKREFKLYEQLRKNTGASYKFITYGNESDLSFNHQKFDIYPLYSKVKFRKNEILQFINSFKILKVYKSEIKEAEIIKTNQLNGAWIGILAKILYKKKLLVRTGYDIHYFSSMQRKSLFKLYFFNILTFLSLYFSDYYVVSSDADMERLILRYGINFKSKIRVNPNWVDTSEEVTSFMERSDKFLSVGRLEEQKNYLNLLQNFSGSDFSIDIYGEGSMKKEIENLIKELDLQAHLKGNIENIQLLEEYQKYKYFILNSHFEGNPKVLLEAMSAGCVVLMRYHENIQNIIEDKVNGFLYNSDEELIKILRNLKNYDLISISKNGRNYIETNNAISQNIKRESNIYKDLLNIF